MVRRAVWGRALGADSVQLTRVQNERLGAPAPGQRSSRKAPVNVGDEHADRFDEEVFFRLHERQLAKFVRDPTQRAQLLTHAYCHAERVTRRYRTEKRFALRMPPELLLAVMDVESRFDRYAVSSAGAVGLMQVMPFWPRELGVENRLFGDADFNIRLGAEILGYYLYLEKNNVTRALGRYNGSLGRREYPDLVLGRLQSRWRG